MLSDEEKKAIEVIKGLAVYYDDYSLLDEEEIEENEEVNNSINIVINLIEKQSKEIEELKATSEYREKIIKGLGLKTLPKTITGFKELIENNDKKWEYKIKAKIEELKETADEDNKDDFIRIEVLQSLLEKE